jgi:hypothetical protein
MVGRGFYSPCLVSTIRSTAMLQVGRGSAGIRGDHLRPVTSAWITRPAPSRVPPTRSPAGQRASGIETNDRSIASAEHPTTTRLCTGFTAPGPASPVRILSKVCSCHAAPNTTATSYEAVAAPDSGRDRRTTRPTSSSPSSTTACWSWPIEVSTATGSGTPPTSGARRCCGECRRHRHCPFSMLSLTAPTARFRSTRRRMQRRTGAQARAVADCDGIPIRAIEYQIDDRAGTGEIFCLITSILDYDFAPAIGLAALYHSRWELELALDEIQTHQVGSSGVLRSRSPELLKQEIWSLLLVHYSISGFHEHRRLRIPRTSPPATFWRKNDTNDHSGRDTACDGRLNSVRRSPRHCTSHKWDQLY